MRFPVSQAGQDALPGNVNIVRVTAKNIDHVRSMYYRPALSYESNPPHDPGRYSYRVGPGDQLRIHTWTTPERTMEGRISGAEGPIVDERGFFFYPFVGEIQASGRTVGEIRNDLSQRLRTYINEPQVEVAVETFRAHSVTVAGEVGSPGRETLTNVPLRLADLLNTAGTTGNSNLSDIKIRRRGQEYSVNLRAYLEAGDTRQNPVLLPNDVVFVPTRGDNKIFAFGEISTTELPLEDVGKSLTEVLAELGGIDRRRANAKGVFVFRQTKVTPSGFDVFQFDLSDASALVMMKEFPVAPLDILFVTKDPVTQWTDTVGRVLSPASSFLQARGLYETLRDE